MKKRRYLLFLVFAIFFLFLTTTPALAAKKRVWGKTIVTPAQSNTVAISAKFSGWKQYLNVSFRGAKNTKAISYEVIYASNGVDQGAGGSVGVDKDSVTKSTFLGTCSHAVCTPHKNISNVRLRVTYVLNNGQTVTKNFKVKY